MPATRRVEPLFYRPPRSARAHRAHQHWRFPIAESSNRSSAGTAILASAATIAGVLGIGAMWTVLNVQTGGAHGWAALVAALDAALLLRLAGVRPGWRRAAVGPLAVLATVAVVAFLTVATRVGFAMGLRPLESAERLGLGLVWTMVQGIASPWDAVAVLLALPLAWLLCR